MKFNKQNNTLSVIINTIENSNLTLEDAEKIINNLDDINEVHIYIHSYGGNVRTYLYIATKLLLYCQDHKITINTYAETEAFSAAVLLWLCGDKGNRHINKYTGGLLFHPIEAKCVPKYAGALNKFYMNNVYNFVKLRTNLTFDEVKNLYENSYENIIDYNLALELNLI